MVVSDSAFTANETSEARSVSVKVECLPFSRARFLAVLLKEVCREEPVAVV